MPNTQTHAWSWPRPSEGAQGGDIDRFPVAFRLGPFQLAEAAVAVTTIDLGDAAIAGDDVDLSPLSGKSLFLKSTPDRLPLTPILEDDGSFSYRLYGYDRCWVATEGNFDDYLASFSKTSRKGLKRRIKQLRSASGGTLDIRHYAQDDVMDVFHQDARSVSAKTFQERLVNDGLPADGGFSQSMRQKVRQGQCYGSVLYLDEQPISYLYCERQRSGWIATYGGFDPAFAKLSPGTVHLLSLLESSFADDDCALFDFGPGHCDYKPFFATHTIPCSDVLVLEKSFRNKAIVGTHRVLGQITACGASLADRLRLKQLVRQRIRGR